LLNNRGMRLWIAVITFTFILGAFGYSGLKADPLRTEAEKVFEYERQHPNTVPANQIRALSIAVEFKDSEGVRRAVERLKAQGL
jgi:hypothetical protein